MEYCRSQCDFNRSFFPANSFLATSGNSKMQMQPDVEIATSLPGLSESSAGLCRTSRRVAPELYHVSMLRLGTDCSGEDACNLKHSEYTTAFSSRPQTAEEATRTAAGIRVFVGPMRSDGPAKIAGDGPAKGHSRMKSLHEGDEAAGPASPVRRPCAALNLEPPYATGYGVLTSSKVPRNVRGLRLLHSDGGSRREEDGADSVPAAGAPRAAPPTEVRRRPRTVDHRHPSCSTNMAQFVGPFADDGAESVPPQVRAQRSPGEFGERMTSSSSEVGLPLGDVPRVGADGVPHVHGLSQKKRVQDPNASGRTNEFPANYWSYARHARTGAVIGV